MSDSYLGGEKDGLKKVTPKDYDNFFRERDLYFVLSLLVIFLVLIRVVP